MRKAIPITVYIMERSPGSPLGQYCVKTEPDSDVEFGSEELGEAVKAAVTAKFIKMATDRMGEPVT